MRSECRRAKHSPVCLICDIAIGEKRGVDKEGGKVWCCPKNTGDKPSLSSASEDKNILKHAQAHCKQVMTMRGEKGDLSDECSLVPFKRESFFGNAGRCKESFSARQLYLIAYVSVLFLSPF